VPIKGKAGQHQRHRALDPTAPFVRYEGIPRHRLNQAVKAQALAGHLDQRITAELSDQPVEAEGLGNCCAEFRRQGRVVLGQEAAWNCLRRQERAEAQQVDGERLSGSQPVNRHGRADRRGIALGRPFLGPQFASKIAEEVEIAGEAYPGLRHVGRRLREREG
jgi:hypothetical protein